MHPNRFGEFFHALFGKTRSAAPTRAVDGDSDALFAELEEALGEFGFRWLCCCAIYPALRFPLTAYLGQFLARECGREAPSEEDYLALCRLPWFRAGAMPPEVRESLKRCLEPQRIESIEGAIKEFLDKADKETLEFVVDPTTQFDINRKTTEEEIPQDELLKHRDSGDTPAADAISVRYVLGSFVKSTRTSSFHASRAIARRLDLPLTGWREDGTIPLAIASVVAGLLIWKGADPLIEPMFRVSETVEIKKEISTESEENIRQPERFAKWRELSSQAIGAYRDKQYETSLKLTQQALEIAQNAFGDRDPATLTSLSNIATLQRLLGSPDTSASPRKAEQASVQASAKQPVLASDTSALYDRPVLVIDPGMHTAPIMRAAVDAAGKYVVTGSDDKTVRVWAVEDGKLLRTIRVPAGPGDVGKIHAVAINPDGSLIAAGGRTAGIGGKEMIYLFDRASGRTVQRITGLPNAVDNLMFSPDGSRLAAVLGGANGLRVYGKDQGWGEIGRDTDYGDNSYGAGFAADGRLATSSYDGKIRLYDRDLRLVATVEAKGGHRPYGTAFSPEGNRLAVGFTDSVAVDLYDGTNLTALRGPDTAGIDNGNLASVAWSVDGATLYAGGRFDRGSGSPVVAWGDRGRGPRRFLTAGRSSVTSLAALPDGGMVASAGDPFLARFDGKGGTAWTSLAPVADFRDQSHTLALSPDGMMVDFGYESGGKTPARIDLASLKLTRDPTKDGVTAPPRQDGLAIENWIDNVAPSLAGKPLPLQPYEISRALAIAPDGQRFVLGTDWTLRAFDRDGRPIWQQPAPTSTWAVNISGDGRLVVAAYGDGTIRWHRLDDGRELLAFMPLPDRSNWVAWTREGFYAATAGTRGVLQWAVNRSWDAPMETIPVSDIANFYRPDAIKLIIREMDLGRVIGLADMARAREAVRRRDAGGISPGARLHVLAVGINDYGPKAKSAQLRYAAADARDVLAAFNRESGGLYAAVQSQFLRDQDATWEGILDAFAVMRRAMQSGGGQDTAVVYFSGHGTIMDEQFNLVTYGIDIGNPAGLKKATLSQAELQGELAQLAALGRVVVLLDTAESGAIADAAVGDTALGKALTAANPRITVLTAASKGQAAREEASLGHGVFTFAVLEALDKADTDRNGIITVSELISYVKARARGLGGPEPQATMSFDGDLFTAHLR